MGFLALHLNYVPSANWMSVRLGIHSLVRGSIVFSGFRLQVMSAAPVYVVIWRCPRMAAFDTSSFLGVPIDYNAFHESEMFFEPSLFVWSGLVRNRDAVVVDVPFSLRASEDVVVSVMTRGDVIPALLVLRSKCFGE
jgi:hypothetical protein